jgi:hypothetical protein
MVVLRRAPIAAFLSVASSLVGNTAAGSPPEPALEPGEPASAFEISEWLSGGSLLWIAVWRAMPRGARRRRWR